MNKTRCIIVDDEPVAQRILESYLADLPEFELMGKYLNALSARQALLENDIDLMFLDLEMPKLKGFSFLKTLSDPPTVIITTAHREYALEGYELEVLDYLLKPISFERFLKAINRYKKNSFKDDTVDPGTLKTAEFIYVKCDRKTLKLNQADILYIEGMNNYIKIHCSNKVHIVYASLSKILSKLGDSFARVHKSYIINKNNITAFSSEQIEVAGKLVPIGNKYRDICEEF